MNLFKSRDKSLKTILEDSLIDIEALQNISVCGIPENDNVRDICWKILLEYLPPEKSHWESELTKNRDLYNEYLYEMIIKPTAKSSFNKSPEHDSDELEREAVNLYNKEIATLMQIDKDCRRLFPDYAFFQNQNYYSPEILINSHVEYKTLRERVAESVLASLNLDESDMIDAREILQKEDSEYVTLPDGQEAHWEVVERILFLYAKLNVGNGYVQGMNELAGPIYYVCATSSHEDSRQNAEADAFFCFLKLMSQVRDNYSKLLDNSRLGISSEMSAVLNIIKSYDVALHGELERQGVHPLFYLFRWLTLLLSQEFTLPDLLRIWDILFGNTLKIKYIHYVCAAMIVLKRKLIMQGDFQISLKALQSNEDSLDAILRTSELIYKHTTRKENEKTLLSRLVKVFRM